MITVSELRIHPIKSMKRTLLDSMEIVSTGPRHDRQFMVIDADNKFMTQRTVPLMATINVEAAEGGFKLFVPGYEEVAFTDQGQGDVMPAMVWRDQVDVVEVSPAASKILSDYLQTPCRLVTMAEGENRLLDENYLKSGVEEVSFADGFPFLLISQASLDDLNSRLESPVPMDRFRPNIVVTGCAPYEEDTWKAIQIGDIIFDVLKPCARCTITTTDQETGDRDKERGKNPLKALARYRNTEKGILFGMNMVHRSVGRVCVGDAVRILTGPQS